LLNARAAIQLKPIKKYVSPEPCFILKRAAAVYFVEVPLALAGRVIHIQIRDAFQLSRYGIRAYVESWLAQ
jgi:hypothetical protein